MALPETVTDVKSFLGFTNYYCKFMHKYAHIAKPLHELTSGENANKKKKVVEWLAVHQNAFEILKRKMSEAPVLGLCQLH